MLPVIFFGEGLDVAEWVSESEDLVVHVIEMANSVFLVLSVDEGLEFVSERGHNFVFDVVRVQFYFFFHQLDYY